MPNEGQQLRQMGRPIIDLKTQKIRRIK